MADTGHSAEPGAIATCLRCGASFQRCGKGRPRKYCSVLCQRRSKKRPPPVAEPKKPGRKPLSEEERRKRKRDRWRAYRDANIEKFRARDKIVSAARRAAQPDHYRLLHRVRYQRNKDREALRNARRRSTVAGRLRNRISSMVYHTLRRAGSGKASKSWTELLAFTPEELIVHLERQFTNGMSWENIGKWHVDHIVPLISFQIKEAGDSEFRAAWALTNLRPLWAEENIRKGGTRTHLL